ncbi:hypothetical protein AC739_19480, partial [Planococcus glaciei]|uniref:glycosyltransferase n=1 Tax=Planococcus glaciei TaxID=459472 RepID=UPI0006C239AE
MKILQIIGNLSSGGAEKFVKDLSIEFNRIKNIKIDILLLTDEKSVYIDELRRNNINVHVIPLKKMLSPLNIIYIKNYIKEGNYDIVHSHLFPSLYWTSIAKRLTTN